MRQVLIAGVLALAGLCAACEESVAPKVDPHWNVLIPWKGEASIQRVKVGHPDPTYPGTQVVAVDESGLVIVARFDGPEPVAAVVHRHPARFTGLAVADVDPTYRGEEIYAGGYEKGDQGGAVVQVALTPSGPKSRLVYRGKAFVHAVESLPPAADGGAPRLLVSDYAGAVHVLTPGPGDGPWEGRLVHQEPRSDNPEVVKIKDVVVLARRPGEPIEVVLLLKEGRTVLLAPDVPGSGRLIHEEKGGLSRGVPDGAGGFWMTGYKGGVVRLERRGEDFAVRTLWTDPAEGLRGVVLGTFPTKDGLAAMAVYGYSKVVRGLIPVDGGWKAADIYEDSEKGHGLVAADLIPGNGGDEIAIASYSKQLIVLVPKKR